MTLFDDLPPPQLKRPEIAELHRLQCLACPLSKVPNEHPNMPPTGAARPLVYIMAEAPGRNEDEQNVQLIGKSGQIVRALIPRRFKDRVRFNNACRTRPPDNRTPTWMELECCRPSVEKDIEQSKPKAIFGLGDVALRWVSGFSGVTVWAGRRMPVKIRSHTCWYYPMLHPAYLIYQRRRSRDGEEFASEEERMFGIVLKRAFEEVEELPEPQVHDIHKVFDRIECITEGGASGLNRVRDALKWAAEQPDIGVDYETDRLRPYDKDARVLSMAAATGKAGVAIPLDHPGTPWTDSEKRAVRSYWYDFLKHARGRKWVHILAFELEWTGVHWATELVRAGRWEDTASQACILDERRGKYKPGPFSLEFLVQQYFGFNLKQLSDVDRKELAGLPLATVLKYNGGDARYHCLIGLAQDAEIKRLSLEEPYRLALRRVPTVVLSQIRGVPVDFEEVARLKRKYEKRLAATEREIANLPVIRKFKKICSQEFQPFSNPDVIYVFKDMLHRREVIIEDKYKKKTKYSADKKVLDLIDHPLAELLVDLRESNKRLATYINPLDPKFRGTVIHDDGLLHAVFNTIFAETGRLSCEAPNLQNFPKRDSEAKELRKQIVAPPGCLILALDFGQIEARVIAMFTKDKVFCKALWEEYDVHMEWAERLARAYPERIGGSKNLKDKQVMKLFRTDIKNQWTFPLFFGARLESASEYLKIPVDVLKPEYNKFWRTFAGVKDWQEQLVDFYRVNGYVECLTGRRRRGPLTLNQIINSPVQGTAAEIVLDSMCRLSETGDPELQPEINIHDDLTFVRVPIKRLDDIAEKVIGIMLNSPFKWINVPITAELSYGENWLDMKEMDTFSSARWGR